MAIFDNIMQQAAGGNSNAPAATRIPEYDGSARSAAELGLTPEQIKAQGKLLRKADPSRKQQEHEGLTQGDSQFRPEDLEIGGIGSIEATRTKGGNFSLDINEDPAVAEMRERLQAQGGQAFDTSGGMMGGVAGMGEGALNVAGQAQGAFGSFDPMQAATERFDALDSILQPGRERERSGLESRLFAQGRLDSTGGARQMGEYEAGIERERANMLNTQFGEAQTAQGNLSNIMAQQGNLGAGVQGGIFNQGLQSIGGANQMSEPMLRMLGLASDMGQRTSDQRNANKAHRLAKKAQDGGGGFMNSVGGKILGTALTGAATAFGSPLAGAAVGSIMGGMGGGGGAAGGTQLPTSSYTGGAAGPLGWTG